METSTKFIHIICLVSYNERAKRAQGESDYTRTNYRTNSRANCKIANELANHSRNCRPAAVDSLPPLLLVITFRSGNDDQCRNDVGSVFLIHENVAAR